MTRLLIAFVLMIAAMAGAEPARAEPDHRRAESPRRSVDLASGWRFRRGGADAPIGDAHDDSGWERVGVPHSWNRVGEYSLNRDPRTDLYQGVGWYRLRFPTPAHKADERHFLQFDGVGSIAEVWLNGRRLGEHRGAFSRFRFEVTGLLRADRPNLVAVRADNSERKAGSSTADVIPLSGDFFIFGGVYRGVSLVTTSAAHVDLMDHGGPGVYATTDRVTAEAARISVRTRVAARPRPVTLSVSLDDATGREVASARSRVAAGGLREVATRLDLPSPRLWNGRADPYLYRLRVELLDGPRLLDRVVEPYGVRSFAIDPDTGFSLNGKPLRLQGVSRHQDWMAKGWAIEAAEHRADMALAEELGANTIRMAHYQHAPEWFDLADRAGMVVWAELPFVNQVAWTDSDASPALAANARTQLVELIRQNFNRPGVVTWSVGNEVDIHRRGDDWGDHSLKLLRELAALARREDPSRPTVFADCCEESVEGRPDPGRKTLAGAADLIGYNRYFGWYYGRPDQLGPALDILHARHPRLPMSVSEYGAGGSLTQHSDDPRGGPVAEHGRPQPEEYQSFILEQAWPAIAARPYLWGSWLWNLVDFATRTRSEGDATDLNTKGLVTADRKTRKDAFYYIQANWSDRPVLHLTGKRYVDRVYPVVDVRAYSNAATARLTVNGRDLGSRPCPGRICAWPGVRLDRGENVVAIAATVAGRTLTDEARWTAPDARAGLAIDAGALVGGTVAGRRYGSDAFFDSGASKALKPEAVTGDAASRPLALSVRTGDFSYRLPLPDGRWRVRASLVEGVDAISIRNGGKTAMVAPTGTPGRQVEHVAPATSRGGFLDLAFHTSGGLAALVIEPQRR